MNRPKTRKCKALLALLGCDPNEPIPTFEEAMDSVQNKPVEERVLCPVSGKHSFTSEGAARQAANNRMKKGSGTGKLRVYRCDSCNQWHLSSSFFKQ